MPRISNFASLFKKTVSEFSDDDCMTLAAALAYYTVFSLPSILMIVIFIASSVLGQGTQGATTQGIGQTVGPGVGGQVSEMVQHAQQQTSGGTIAAIFAVIGLAFSATSALVQLQTSLNRAWDVKTDPNASGWKTFLWKRIYSFGLFVAVGVLLIVFLALSALAQKFGNLLPIPGFLIVLAEALISLGVITFLFAAIFEVLPDVEITWDDVWVGAFVTAILFVIGKYLVGLYLSHSGVASGYGAAGSLAVLLLWTYYSAITFLLGAEFTQVWVRRKGREIQPSKGAVRIIEREERPDQMRPAA